MNAAEFTELCESHHACREGLKWIKGKSLREFWDTCERADWMLWLCDKMVDKPGWPTRQELVLAACLCAETVLPIFEKKYPNDNRPRNAIETARAWANGKATIEEVRAASYAAADAYYYAAYAASDAAFYAAYAAYAAAYAYYGVYAADAANFEALKSMADIVRQNLKFPMVHP